MAFARDGAQFSQMGPEIELRDRAPLGRALAKTLGTKAAVLMRGHGAVIVASSIPNVVGRSVYLDLNARAQLQAIQLGGKLTYVEADEAKLRMTDPNEYSRAWDLWKRKVVNSQLPNSNSQR